MILQTTSIRVDPDSLFDVQVKRIHEYKRQLLNVMRIVHEYLCLIEDGRPPAVPRTYIFAGKAAPGLLGRATDHQVDLPRGFDHQRRPSRERADQGRVRPGLSRVAGGE